MFQLLHRSNHQLYTIYGVHKSGPQHHQTKFLIFDCGAWRWVWASEFTPLPGRPTSEVQRPSRRGRASASIRRASASLLRPGR